MTDTNGQDAPNTDGQTPPAARTEISSLPGDVQDYIKRLNDENKTRREQNETLTRTMQEQRDAKLAEDERWQELAETRQTEIERLKGVEDQFTSVNTTLDGLLEAQLADLSDDAKAMVPKALSTQDQINWIAENRQRLTRPSAPPMDAGARGDRVAPDKAIPPEEMAAFLASGLSKEVWNKKKSARRSEPEGDFLKELRARNQPQEQ